MPIRNLYIILALLSFLSAAAQKKEVKQIRKTFEHYKTAILNDKGEDAVKFVDSRTLNYYSHVLNLVKNADSAEVNALSLMDKLMVLSVRHRADKNEISAMDGKSLFVYAVKSGMVGKNSVSENEIGDVTIDSSFAKGQFISKGQKTPIYFHFYKEEGSWKIDLTSIFPMTFAALQKVIEKSGKSENEYLLMILEMVSGKKPGREIWKRIQ